MVYKLLWLAAGGAAGTLARYGLTGLVQRVLVSVAEPLEQAGGRGGVNAWGTLVVNVLGCFLFGLGWSLFEQAARLDGPVRLAVLTGFLGAFTTFSTYAFESVHLLRSSQWFYAVGSVIAQNGLGLGAVLLGLALGRR